MKTGDAVDLISRWVHVNGENLSRAAADRPPITALRDKFDFDSDAVGSLRQLFLGNEEEASLSEFEESLEFPVPDLSTLPPFDQLGLVFGGGMSQPGGDLIRKMRVVFERWPAGGGTREVLARKAVPALSALEQLSIPRPDDLSEGDRIVARFFFNQEERVEQGSTAVVQGGWFAPPVDDFGIRPETGRQ